MRAPGWMVVSALLVCIANACSSSETDTSTKKSPVGGGEDASAGSNNAAGGTSGQGGMQQGGTEQGGASGGSSQGGQAGSYLPDAGGCKAISVSNISVSEGQIQGVVSPALGNSDPDVFSLELFERKTFVQESGTYDLTMVDEADYATCNHCVIVRVDVGTPTQKIFFQRDGVLTLEEVTSPPTPQAAGELKYAKLVEVTIDPITRHSTQVAGGDCLDLSPTVFDTTPPDIDAGSLCKNPSDCTSSYTMVCDPKTQQCLPYQCNPPDEQCAEGEVCLAQVDNALAGACYNPCVPFAADACPDGQCIPTIADLTKGVCYHTGAGQDGDSCDPSVVNTGCIQGYVCVEEPDTNGGTSHVCRQTCDYWGASHEVCLVDDQHCLIGGYCSFVLGDPASRDTPCNSPKFTWCAADGDLFEGVCMSYNGGMVCRKLCRLTDGHAEPDCIGSPTSCQQSLTVEQVGACM